MRHNSNNRNRMTGMLIALPFLLLGLAGWGLGLYPVLQHVRSASWQSVPATLLSLSESGGRQRIGDAYTSRPQGEYVYRWQGREYRGQRLYFGSMRDNFDDGWRERLAAEVGQPGDTITVWVNPADPSEAVALRAVRWLELGMALLGGSMFGAGGAALLYAALRRPGSEREIRRPRVSWPLVLGLAATAPIWAVLAYLLWHDGHQLWAVAASLPIWLALNGIRAGLLQRRQSR